MIKIQVRYYLSQKGKEFFSDWYERVLQTTALQDGFVKMDYRMEDDAVIVNLNFKNQITLDKWTDTELHDYLAGQIDPYLIRPSDVLITEE
jgi:hypothetical protein